MKARAGSVLHDGGRFYGPLLGWSAAPLRARPSLGQETMIATVVVGRTRRSPRTTQTRAATGSRRSRSSLICGGVSNLLFSVVAQARGVRITRSGSIAISECTRLSLRSNRAKSSRRCPHPSSALSYGGQRWPREAANRCRRIQRRKCLSGRVFRLPGKRAIAPICGNVVVREQRSDGTFLESSCLPKG